MLVKQPGYSNLENAFAASGKCEVLPYWVNTRIILSKANITGTCKISETMGKNNRKIFLPSHSPPLEKDSIPLPPKKKKVYNAVAHQLKNVTNTV